MVSCDEDEDIIEINEGWYVLLGWSALLPAAAHGCAAEKACHPFHAPACIARYQLKRGDSPLLSMHGYEQEFMHENVI